MGMINLSRLSRIERLRDIVEKVGRGEKFTAFELAAKYNISLNTVYRDLKQLKDAKLISADFKMERFDIALPW